MWVSARPRAVWKGAGCKEGGVCETGGCVAGQKEGEGEKGRNYLLHSTTWTCKTKNCNSCYHHVMRRQRHKERRWCRSV